MGKFTNWDLAIAIADRDWGTIGKTYIAIDFS
jgi:hypothetical protein